jgi:hypothetical protein
VETPRRGRGRENRQLPKHNEVIEFEREAWLRTKGKVLMFVEVPFMALGWVLGSLAWPNRNERKEK